MKPILKSDNFEIEKAFNWAVDKTAQFVVSKTVNGERNRGDGGKWYGPDNRVIDKPCELWAKPADYMPSFWAGYYDRTAFYLRDFVHQAAGAHLVGLDEEIYNMYMTFINSACEKTGGYALWSFNFDGSVYYMDTPNYNSFVREITGQFELCELAYKLFLWTGDERYVTDKRILNFIDYILGDFILKNDKNKNGIPEGKGSIWAGSASYNERGAFTAETGDEIAALYAALKAYSNILRLNGMENESKFQMRRVQNLKNYYNNKWSFVEKSDKFAFAADNNGNKQYIWKNENDFLMGGESLVFVPVKYLTYPGERTNKLLEYIDECEENPDLRQSNIESLTYLPDAFFAYGKGDLAYKWMKYIFSKKDLPHERASQGLNGDYPEISFTLIEQTVCGLGGIVPTENGICIFPSMPNEIDYLDFKHLPVCGGYINVKVSKTNAVIYNCTGKSINIKCRCKELIACNKERVKMFFD